MLKGRITVEASFIIPVFIIIICSFIYETMLACDRGTMNMCIDKYLQEALGSVENGELTKERISKKLLIYEVEKCLVEKNNNELMVNVKAKPIVSLGIIGDLKGNFRDYEVNRKVNLENICTPFRRIGIVKDES